MKIFTENTKNYKSVILLPALIFASEILVCSFFVNTHDDYLTAGVKTFYEAFDYSIHYGNGRILGNALVELLCNRHILNCLFKSVCLFLLIVLMSYLCSRINAKNLIIFFFLVNCAPIAYYKEVFVWSHGFYNYVPPVVLLLITLAIMKSIYLGKKEVNVFTYIALILCGISAQLFSENSTVINIITAVAITALVIKNKKKTLPALVNLFSSITGAVIMAAVPKLLNVSDKMSSYRGLTPLKNMSFAESISSHFFIELKYIGDMYPLWLIFSAVLLIAVHKRKDKLSKLSRIIYDVVFSLSFLIFITKILLTYEIIFVTNANLMLILSLSVAVYITFSLLVLLKLFSKDELKHVYFFLPLAIISVGELLIVHPIGYRCLFITYILLSIPAVNIINRILGECRFNIKVLYAIIAVTTVAINFVNAYHYAYIGKVNDARIEYAQEQIDEGKYDIEIINLPYEDWLWYANESYAYKYTFNQGNPDEMTFSYITYDEYLQKCADE